MRFARRSARVDRTGVLVLAEYSVVSDYTISPLIDKRPAGTACNSTGAPAALILPQVAARNLPQFRGSEDLAPVRRSPLISAITERPACSSSVLYRAAGNR